MDNTVERPQTQRIRIEQHSAIGMLWFGGWLFTMGVLHLSFGKAVLAVVIWPFYLGVALAPLLRP
jgi:hypothetical protein